jgi:hypothetical protein
LRPNFEYAAFKHNDSRFPVSPIGIISTTT